VIDNSLSFALALHPNRVRVAGVLLMPLCLGHAILLTRIKSPLAGYWTGEQKEIGVADIAWALWICERHATEAHRKLGSWWTIRRVKKLAKQVAEHGSIATVRGMFEYLEQGFSGPKMRRESNSKPCGSPLLAMLYASLLSHFHRSDSDAFNTPISLALWNRAALLEEKGIAKVWTDEDEEFAETARSMTQEEAEEILRKFENQPKEGQ
jgi:hypothetical protein